MSFLVVIGKELQIMCQEISRRFIVLLHFYNILFMYFSHFSGILCLSSR